MQLEECFLYEDMNKSITKYYLASILTLLSIVVLLLIGIHESSYQRKRSKCLREINVVLSCVRSSMDFDTFDAALKKRMDSLADFLIKELAQEGPHFDEDKQTVELFEQTKRIHALIGGREWLEKGQRQALFRLHETLVENRDDEMKFNHY